MDIISVSPKQHTQSSKLHIGKNVHIFYQIAKKSQMTQINEENVRNKNTKSQTNLVTRFSCIYADQRQQLSTVKLTLTVHVIVRVGCNDHLPLTVRIQTEKNVRWDAWWKMKQTKRGSKQK